MRSWQIVLGLVALILFLVLRMPLSVVAPRLVPDGAGFGYERVAGTLWVGEIEGAEVRGVFLGTVGLRLRLRDLLSLGLGYQVEARRGDVDVEGVIKRQLGKGLVLSDMQIQGRVDRLVGHAPIGAGLVSGVRGSYRVDLDRVVLEGRACQAGSGMLWSDALFHGLDRTTWRGPILAGTLECEAGRLELALAGQEKGDAVSFTYRQEPGGSYHLHGEILSSHEDLAKALPLIGFESKGSGYQFDLKGGPNGTP